MIKRNKSAAYGYYGGVSKANHYVPGSTSNSQAWSLSQEFKNFLLQNAENIVLRQTLSSAPENVDTFMFYTSGKPEDVVVYQTNKDTVVLDNLAGSGITSSSNQPVDGGTF